MPGRQGADGNPVRPIFARSRWRPTEGRADSMALSENSLAPKQALRTYPRCVDMIMISYMILLDMPDSFS